MHKIDDIEKIKKVELDILLFVRDFCEKKQLRYFLCGGTLLGAVRHKGFIPWDDDIDIYMPRPDYDKFLMTFNLDLSENYKVLSPQNEGYYYNFAKVIDTRTKLIENNVNEISEMGVYIDIFPLEGMPTDCKEQKTHFKKLNRLRESIFDYEYRFPKIRKNLGKYIYRIYTYILCQFRSLNECQENYIKEALKYPYNESEFVFVTGGRYKTKDIFPVEYIGDGVKIQFENEVFCAPAEYKKVLSQIYGDYMKLPPQKDRVNRHSFIAFYKE